jgi:hypothetical protein
MKVISVRMPEEILDWLREKSAMETIRLKKHFSINSYILNVLRREMEADADKQKAKSLTGHECQGYG